MTIWISFLHYLPFHREPLKDSQQLLAMGEEQARNRTSNSSKMGKVSLKQL